MRCSGGQRTGIIGIMIIDGKQIAKNIISELKSEVDKLPFRPVFCDILVGNDPVSLSYVKIKGRTAESAGLSFLLEQLPEVITTENLIEKIGKLNDTQNLYGLILQLPVPKHISRQSALDAINPKIDVDCLGSQNMEQFFSNQDSLIPPTAAAVMEIIGQLPEKYFRGQFVIVGQGQLVGRPVGELLRRKGYKFTVADRSTADLQGLCKSADVLISATGEAGIINSDFVKDGAAVIDAGTAEMDGGIVGDVDFAAVKNIAAYITPVPGGVGPVTVAMLLKNVVEVARASKK